MEEIARSIDRQFNPELVLFARVMRLLVYVVLFLIAAFIVVRFLRSGRILSIPPDLILPFAFFGVIGVLSSGFLGLAYRREAEADEAIDQLGEGLEPELTALVKGPTLLQMSYRRRHVRRGRISDYLDYLASRLPGNRSKKEFLARWESDDIANEVAEASRDCERLAPWLGNSVLLFVIPLGLSQGIVSEVKDKLELNIWASASLQLLILLTLVACYGWFISSQRKPGLNRFYRVVSELNDGQLEDLKNDPHLVALVRQEEFRRKSKR